MPVDLRPKRGLRRDQLSNSDPDWILAMTQLEKEENRVETEAQEGAGQEGPEASADAGRVLTWRLCHVGQFDYYELAGAGCSVTLEPRPAYCDRGHWIGKADGPLDLDGQDGFPRYYMDFERAKAELHDWLIWRLERLGR